MEARYTERAAAPAQRSTPMPPDPLILHIVAMVMVILLLGAEEVHVR